MFFKAGEVSAVWVTGLEIKKNIQFANLGQFPN